MSQLPRAPQRLIATTVLIVLSGIVLLLSLWADTLNPYLRYEYSVPFSDAPWRWLSAHWVHLNTYHALLNIAGGLILAIWLGGLLPLWIWLVSIPLISAGICLCLILFQPGIHFYVGFSGVLHGLLVLGFTRLYDINKLMGGLALAIIVAKLILEHWQPSVLATTEALIEGRVISIAHIYGAIMGLFLAVAVRLAPIKTVS